MTNVNQVGQVAPQGHNPSVDAVGSVEQLLQFDALARASLANWPVHPASELSLIKHRENAVYKLVSPEGARYVLRVHRAGYHSDDALRSELQWMAALNAGGFHTPQSIRSNEGEWFVSLVGDSDGQHYQLDLLTWVDGEPLGSVEEGLSGDTAVLVANYRQVGVLAARLHNVSARWQRPEGFTRHAWDVTGCLSEKAIWGDFKDLRALSPDQLKTLEVARGALIDLLNDLGKEPDVYGLIHCDFLPENLLATDDEIYLIDFDDAGFGWYLFELATSLFFLLGEPYFDDVLHAFVEGYRSERPLSDRHLALLPAFFLLRALVYLGWAHTRKETDTAKELTQEMVDAAVEMAEAFISDTNN